uniref:Uncharacterized protein n=1 Tax=Zea mays TaxID=4577 RepID=B6TU27_MAIZE|nr:hypothetical protein [Zea mays]
MALPWSSPGFDLAPATLPVALHTFAYSLPVPTSFISRCRRCHAGSALCSAQLVECQESARTSWSAPNIFVPPFVCCDTSLLLSSYCLDSHVVCSLIAATQRLLDEMSSKELKHRSTPSSSSS